MMRPIIFMLTYVVTFSNVVFAENAKNSYKLGDTIADFNLKNIDGNFKSLKDYKQEKGIILIFTCNHCPFSVAYEDRIIALHNKYASLGYPVVAINPNDAKTNQIDSYENMQERALEKGFPFHYLHDESQEIAKRFGATKTPHVFIVSNQNNYYKITYIGAIDDNSFEQESVKQKFTELALDQLLKGLPVSITETKAIGCGIKWKK